MIYLAAFFIYFLGIIEYKLFKIKFSPLMCLFYPVTTILLLKDVLQIKTTSAPVLDSIEYWKILCINCFIFFSISFLFNINKKRKNDSLNFKYHNRNIYIFIVILCTLSLCIATFVTINKYGILKIKGNLSGIFAHIYLMLSSFMSISFIKIRKGIFLYITYFFMIISVSLLLLGTKGNTLLFLLPIFFYFLYKKEKMFSLKNILIIFIILVIVFFVFYCTYYINIGNKMNIFQYNKFIIYHLRYYLFSPVENGTYFLTLKGDYANGFRITFRYFINMYEFITQNKNYVTIDQDFALRYNVVGQVGGIIPELVVLIGKKQMYMYIFFLGVFSYFIEQLMSKNLEWIFLNFKLKSCLILCFFANFFTTYGAMESIIFSFIITLIIIKVSKNFTKNKRGDKNERNNTCRRIRNKTLSCYKSNIKTNNTNL